VFVKVQLHPVPDYVLSIVEVQPLGPQQSQADDNAVDPQQRAHGGLVCDTLKKV
jgi:hypothetical protein